MSWILVPSVARSTASLIDPFAALDGRLNAPSGAAQFPNLLSGYSIKPSWHVASVSYAVGPPSGTVFKTPGVDSPPVGVSVDATNFIFTITASNVTLDSWDFTVNGGWQVLGGTTADAAGSNLIITKCKFKVGATAQMPIKLLGIDNFSSIAQNCTITYCLIDGNNVDFETSDGIIHIGWGGLLTLKYNLIANAACDLMDLGADFISANRPCSIDMQFNYIAQSGQGAAGHADWLQTAESASVEGRLYGAINIKFNTIVQTSFGATGGSQGFTLDANTKTNYTIFVGGSIANNTIIVTSPAGELGWAFRMAKDCTNGTWNCTNNYFDPTGFSAPTNQNGFKASVGSGPYNGNVACSGNLSMIDGSSMDNSF